jgi:hypothetical protein
VLCGHVVVVVVCEVLCCCWCVCVLRMFVVFDILRRLCMDTCTKTLFLFSFARTKQWDGDLNEIKARVKDSIETMAAGWTLEEKAECVSGTAGAFKFGGAVNSYLSGGRSPH